MQKYLNNNTILYFLYKKEKILEFFNNEKMIISQLMYFALKKQNIQIT